MRAQGLEASRGATDFGESSFYFSFFIVVSALLLVALFFKLGIEQRVREVGLLRSVGFGPSQVRGLFLQEGLLLAVVGSVLGIGGALGYAWLMMYGLRSWWVDAVGTTALTLHVSPASLVGGAIGGVIAAVGCIWWTLRALSGISERSLLMGTLDNSQLSNSQLPMSARAWKWPIATATLAVLRVAAPGRCDDRLRRARGRVLRCRLRSVAGVVVRVDMAPPASRAQRNRRSRLALGVQAGDANGNLSSRPQRAVHRRHRIRDVHSDLCRGISPWRSTHNGPRSGVGGYDLLVETLLPIVRDPNTREGREALNLFDLDQSVTFEPLRLLPGDDASCLNLYEPRNARIVAASERFLRSRRFAFGSSLATTDAERANPWLLLEKAIPDSADPGDRGCELDNLRAAQEAR